MLINSKWIRRNTERLYPLIIPFIVLFILYFIKIYEIKIPRFDVFIGSLITVSVTIIGFIITIITILIGILDRKIMTVIHKNKATGLLRKYLTCPVILGFFLIIYLLYLSYVIDTDNSIEGILLYAMLYLIFSFFLSIFRLVHILSGIFKSVSDEYLDDVNKNEECYVLREDEVE